MRKNTLGILILILLAPGLAFAGKASDKSVNQLMSISGISKQVEQLPAAVVGGLQQAQQQGSPIPQKEFNDLAGAMKSAFAPKAINNTIKAEVKKQLTDKDAKQLLSWYNSELGKKITKAEEKASSPEAAQQMAAQAQALMADQERVQLASKIAGLVNAADMAVDLQKHTSKAVFGAISAAMNPGQKIDMSAIEAQLAANEPQIRANMQQLIVLSLLYSHQELSSKEIQQYLKFLEQPATKKFNNAVVKAMGVALTHSVDKMAKAMADIAKTAKKS